MIARTNRKKGETQKSRNSFGEGFKEGQAGQWQHRQPGVPMGILLTASPCHRDMLARQRYLLAVAAALEKHGRSQKTFLMKTLFWISQQLPDYAKYYGFFAYKYGPYSDTVYSDISELSAEGFIEDKSPIHVRKNPERPFQMTPELVAQIGDIAKRFTKVSTLKQYIYGQYPKYTVRSTLLEQEKKHQTGYFSIGYEGRNIDEFRQKLIENDISVLVDVRKNAFSMKPAFSKNPLERYLERVDIAYVHISQLGIASDKRKNLETQADKDRLFDEYRIELKNKKDELSQILELGKKQRIALLCFEHAHTDCHRGVISQALEKQGLTFTHL